MLAVAHVWLLLRPGQPHLIEIFPAPIDLTHPSVQARLIGRLGKLRVNPVYAFALRNQQPGQIFPKVFALRLIREEPPEIFHGLLHNRWKCYCSWHTPYFLPALLFLQKFRWFSSLR